MFLHLYCCCIFVHNELVSVCICIDLYILLNWNKGRLGSKADQDTKASRKARGSGSQKIPPSLYFYCICNIFLLHFYCISIVSAFTKQGVAGHKRSDPGGRHNLQCFLSSKEFCSSSCIGKTYPNSKTMMFLPSSLNHVF